ncbi:MAG: sodium transporter [Bacteroidetes bacterium]|nr:MAG: sodium transporter [Bacteroidota bacterium]
MPSFELTTLDLSMVVLYVLFIVGLGFYFARKTQDETDYFLAGRSLTWWLIGFSLLASNLSSSSLLGMAGEAYSRGIAVYNYEWMAALILIVFVLFFLPFYLKNRIFTMPEFLERRFDARSRYWFSGITILGNIIIDTAAALYAGAVVVGILYPDVPMWQTIAVLAVLAGLYTIAGGLAAVVYTDAVQAVLLLLGSVLISWTAFQQVGSWEAVQAAVPPEDLSLILPADHPVLPWTGLITGVFLLGFYFWTNNQFMVQRVLGAKDLDHGRWGALFAGALKLPILFIMVMPGTFARLLYPVEQYPALANPDYVFPTMMFDLLPVGLRGLVITALIAAIMSSVDSTLNAASTLVTMDFMKKLRPQADRKTLVWTGRVTTFVFMVFAAAWAPQIVKFPTIWQYLQEVLSYIAPPVVACFVVGIFWKRATGTGAFAGLAGGHLVGLGLFYLRSIQDLPAFQFQFLYISVVLFVVSVILIVAVSLITPAPDPARLEAVTWSPRLFRQETEALRGVPWYKNYRIQALALAAATFVFVYLFR